ncbi:mRNA splicing factor [Spinellus fusiger]|nr:mRNA splicing factor [Spinellus fusiger]
MEEEAQKRKERLESIRKRKLSKSQDSIENTDTEKKLSFRSYIPNDETLKQHANIVTPDDIGDTIESETKHITKEVLSKATEKEKEEVDLFNLAPKKANWDLKRDVEKKLEKLDRKTQRAVLQILRQRLTVASVDGVTNLVEAVANAEAQQQLEAQDE